MEWLWLGLGLGLGGCCVDVLAVVTEERHSERDESRGSTRASLLTLIHSAYLLTLHFTRISTESPRIIPRISSFYPILSHTSSLST